MTIFSYGFGMSLSFAIAIAIGNAWTRDHRRGVWTIRMAAVLTGIAVIAGLGLGWSLDQYFAFVAASATR